MSRTVICEHCNSPVLLNGIGSSRNKLQRALTATFQFMLPMTSKKFLEPSEIHDLEVHQARHSLVDKDWYKYVDAKFYRGCLEKAKQSNWLGKRYYKKQAESLNEALELNDGSGYAEVPCDYK